jgi:hypothetical protein
MVRFDSGACCNTYDIITFGPCLLAAQWASFFHNNEPNERTLSQTVNPGKHEARLRYHPCFFRRREIEPDRLLDVLSRFLFRSTRGSAGGEDSVSCRVSEGGGIFKRFYVTKLVAGKMDHLEVSIRFDSGSERPMECHFFVPLREAANSVEQLAPHVMLPLGSELMRRRGETFHTTVEIVIRSGQKQVLLFFFLQESVIR